MDRAMPPPVATNKQRIITIYVLIALGFVGLIGAHEVAVNWPSTEEDTAIITVPFILAAAGTLCFVAAGLLARKLMKGGVSR
jgi:hypothetical protein